jgi:hypothetical protein
MLDGVVKGKLKPPRIIIYGPPKIGKSTLGADAPAPIFVTTEDGADGLESLPQFPRAETWAALMGSVRKVADEKHDYKTVVIDTINGAAELCAMHVCATKFKGDWGPAGFGSFGQGLAATSVEMRELLPLLDKCRARGMTVLLLAHAGVSTVRDPVLGDYQKWAPDLDRRIWARVSAWVDVILRADYEVAITEGRDGKRAVHSDSTRVLIASGSAAEEAGARVGYELPERMPLAWSSIAEAIGKESKNVALLARLSTMKSEDQTKACNYLGIASIDEIKKADKAKVAVLLNKLSKGV